MNTDVYIIDNHFQLQVKGVKSYKENSVESYIWNVVVSFEKTFSQALKFVDLKVKYDCT